MQSTKALLNPMPPAGEEERVSKVFQMAEEMVGWVPAGIRLYGISPPLLESFAANIAYFGGGTALSPQLTTMIRYLVSGRARCPFCIDLNERFLVGMGVGLDAVRAAREDIDNAPIDEREKPLLRLALHAVTEPGADAGGLVDAARAEGWSDREIFDAVAQAASNRAFNLVLKTFNVEHEDAFV